MSSRRRSTSSASTLPALPTPAPRTRARPAPAPSGPALVDLLDRLLAGGAAVVGDLTLSIGDVDLVRISLWAVIRSAESEEEPR